LEHTRLVFISRQRFAGTHDIPTIIDLPAIVTGKRDGISRKRGLGPPTGLRRVGRVILNPPHSALSVSRRVKDTAFAQGFGGQIKAPCLCVSKYPRKPPGEHLPWISDLRIEPQVGGCGVDHRGQFGGQTIRLP
jgi:hypothetical protein